jgi:membrane-bound lytic murein transglycosylase B
MNRSTQFLRELLREDDLGRYGCCAGPMQFSLVGSPSTWDSYGVDGDHDGRRSPYRGRDAARRRP